MDILSNEIFFKRTPRITLLGAFWFWGVKRKSYAATVVERIYDYYIRGANNLYIEYLVYYRKEFPNYDTFLEQKYNLFPDEIKEKKSLLLCHKFLRFEADGHVSDLLEDKNIRAAFLKYIGVFSDDY